MKIKTDQYRIRLSMGTSGDWSKIPSLTEENVDALNQIGYSGKVNGVTKTHSQYLSEISKDNESYSMYTIKCNNMEYTEELLVTHIVVD